MARAITPALIDSVAARLSADGWKYTPRQLYYAVCAGAETTRSRSVARGEFGLGVILLLVALILIRFPIPFVILLALGVLLVVLGGARYLQPASPPGGRTLALSYDAFMRVLDGLPSPGLIDVAAKRDHGIDQAVARAHNTVVVCDRSETVAIVNANAEKAGLSDAVAVDAAEVTDSFPWLSAIALHDAAPRGCALVLELADRGLHVVDAGLRPEWVDSTDHQALEGAPARLPRDMSTLLSAEEILWLATGRRVEVATLTPAQVMLLLGAAHSGGEERTAGVRVVTLDAEQRTRMVAPHPRG